MLHHRERDSLMNAAFRGANPNRDASNEDVSSTLERDPYSVYNLEIGFHSSPGRLQSVSDRESRGYISTCGRFLIYSASDRSFVVSCLDRINPFPYVHGGSTTEQQQGIRILDEYARQQARMGQVSQTPNISARDIQAAIAAGIQQQMAAMGLSDHSSSSSSNSNSTKVKVEQPPSTTTTRTIESEIRARIESEYRARQVLEDELKARQLHDIKTREERDAQIKAEIENDLHAKYQREAILKAKNDADLKARELKAQQQREAEIRAQQLREAEFRAQTQRDAEYLAQREAEIRADCEAQLRAHGLLLSPTSGVDTRLMALKPPPHGKKTTTTSSWPVVDLNSPVVIGVVVVVALLFLHNQSLGHEVQAQRFQGARERAHSEAFEQRARNEIIAINSDWNQKYTRLHDEASYMRGEMAGRSKRGVLLEQQEVEEVRKREYESTSSFTPSLFNMLVVLCIVMAIYKYLTYYAAIYGASYSDDDNAALMGDE